MSCSCRLAQLQQAQDDEAMLRGFAQFCDEKKWMKSLFSFVRLAETMLGPYSPKVRESLLSQPH